MFRTVLILMSCLLLWGPLFLVDGAELHNPLRPPAGYRATVRTVRPAKRVQHDWILQAVIIGADRAVAVIDGHSVARGERYQGARLIYLQKDRVELQRRDGRRIVLKMTSALNKKIAATTEKKSK